MIHAVTRFLALLVSLSLIAEPSAAQRMAPFSGQAAPSRLTAPVMNAEALSLSPGSDLTPFLTRVRIWWTNGSESPFFWQNRLAPAAASGTAVPAHVMWAKNQSGNGGSSRASRQERRVAARNQKKSEPKKPSDKRQLSRRVWILSTAAAFAGIATGAYLWPQAKTEISEPDITPLAPQDLENPQIVRAKILDVIDQLNNFDAEIDRMIYPPSLGLSKEDIKAAVRSLKDLLRNPATRVAPLTPEGRRGIAFRISRNEGIDRFEYNPEKLNAVLRNHPSVIFHEALHRTRQQQEADAASIAADDRFIQVFNKSLDPRLVQEIRRTHRVIDIENQQSLPVWQDLLRTHPDLRQLVEDTVRFDWWAEVQANYGQMAFLAAQAELRGQPLQAYLAGRKTFDADLLQNERTHAKWFRPDAITLEFLYTVLIRPTRPRTITFFIALARTGPDPAFTFSSLESLYAGGPYFRKVMSWAAETILKIPAIGANDARPSAVSTLPGKLIQGAIVASLLPFGDSENSEVTASFAAQIRQIETPYIDLLGDAPIPKTVVMDFDYSNLGENLRALPRLPPAEPPRFLAIGANLSEVRTLLQRYPVAEIDVVNPDRPTLEEIADAYFTDASMRRQLRLFRADGSQLPRELFPDATYSLIYIGMDKTAFYRIDVGVRVLRTMVEVGAIMLRAGGFILTKDPLASDLSAGVRSRGVLVPLHPGYYDILRKRVPRAGLGFKTLVPLGIIAAGGALMHSGPAVSTASLAFVLSPRIVQSMIGMWQRLFHLIPSPRQSFAVLRAA